jgi:hypothetical protein
MQAKCEGMASARSAVVLPIMSAAPYSVTIYCVSVRGSVVGPGIFGTMRETAPLTAVECAVRIDFPPSDNCAPRTKSSCPPGAVYCLPSRASELTSPSNPITQGVAYNSLLAERRKLLHERAAAALEAMFAEHLEDHLSELAHHYSRSDNVVKAVDYLRRASEQAVERSAYSEAAADLKAAIALVGRLPEGPDRLRIELALHATEGSVATVLHGIGSQERERALARSCEISERLGDTASLLRGSILLSSLYLARGEPLRAREICSRHLELAEQSGVMEVPAPAHWIIGLSLLFSGNLNRARRTWREWMERFEAVPHGAFPINLSVSAAGHCCLTVHLLGGISEALKLSQESLGRARALNHQFTLGMVLTAVAWLYQVRREPEAVREVAEAAMALGEEHGFPEGWSGADGFTDGH